MQTEHELTIDELARQAGVPVRTIRYYIAEGLLPGPEGRGKAAAYGEEHLLRLRLIRRLVEQRVPLAEVRARVALLPLDEVRALLSEEEQRTAELARAARAPSPRDYVAALLSRARAAAPQPEPEAFAAPPRPGCNMREARLDPYRPLFGAGGEMWERLTLADGVELHIRSDVRKRRWRLIRRLLQAAEAEPPPDQDPAR